MTNGRLEKRWLDLFGIANDPVKSKEAFLVLSQKYSESHRHYHTFQHIRSCLALFDEVAENINDTFSVESAIWFHDVIYNPRRNDNEQMSADHSKSFLESIRLEPPAIKRIEHLIILTQHPSRPVASDEKYLVDIDLSILGAEEQLYELYERSIRKEYAFVPGIIYRRGRGKLLKKLFQTGRIYHTDYFRDKYEYRARQNIERALRRL